MEWKCWNKKKRKMFRNWHRWYHAKNWERYL